MKRINISLPVLAAIIIGVAIVAGLIGSNGNTARINGLHNDLIKALDDVQTANSALGKCQVMRDHYETLYNLNK